MRATLQKLWDAAFSSYWFIPSLMALGAIALSVAATSVDGLLGADWTDGIEWIYANKPAGARALLSTIAGSMITVAGVTFSITIAAVSYATSQFGPRLLTNFMQDRGNQITLGTFIATFLYCLLVLRTIRSADEAAGAVAFVPHVAVLCAVGLALASIGVLIFFIHHVPESIHASNVVADVGRALNHKIEQLFPKTLGQGVPDDDGYDPRDDVPAGFVDEAAPVEAGGVGYVEYVDEKGLIEMAKKHGLILRLEVRPGDFVTHDRTLALVWPPARVDDEVAHAVRSAFAWGAQRTQTQDVLFLVNELVEIASRALSPGTNDPFTAMNCFDWLGSALANMAGRDGPGAFRYDGDEHLRVVVRPVTFDDFAEAALAPPRPYAAADRNAALHLMKTIAEVALVAKDAAERRCLLRHAEDLRHAAEAGLEHEADREALRARFRVVARLLQNRSNDGRALADRHAWLGGSG